MASGETTGAHIASIEARVGALEQGILTLSDKTDRQFAAVMAKLDERAKTQWPVLISGAMLIVAIIGSLGVALWSPIREGLVRIDQGVATLEREKIGRMEADMWSKLRDEQFSRLDERDTLSDKRLQKLESKVFGF